MDVKKKKNIISPPLGLCTSQNLNFSAFQAAMQLGSSAVSALPMLIRAAVENEPPPSLLRTGFQLRSPRQHAMGAMLGGIH